jgi:nucleotidyltransferase substrate binding protein (TIGR01987 family)
MEKITPIDLLKLRYKILLKAYKTLDRGIKKLKSSIGSDQDTIETNRDSMIKRFEYCYDLTWKYLKQYLDTVHGIEVSSPKKIYLECFSQNIITQDEVNQLLGAVDDRNMTSHTYDEEYAQEISERIFNHFPLMNALVTRIIPPSNTQ